MWRKTHPRPLNIFSKWTSALYNYKYITLPQQFGGLRASLDVIHFTHRRQSSGSGWINFITDLRPINRRLTDWLWSTYVFRPTVKTSSMCTGHVWFAVNATEVSLSPIQSRSQHVLQERGESVCGSYVQMTLHWRSTGMHVITVDEVLIYLFVYQWTLYMQASVCYQLVMFVQTSGSE